MTFGVSSTTAPSATPDLKADSITTTSATPIPSSISNLSLGPLTTSSPLRDQEPDPVRHDDSPSSKLRIILGASLGGLSLLLLLVISIYICRKRNMKKLNDASTYMGGHSSFYERVI